MNINLFEKRELWITDIKLDGANLNDIASAVAGTLKIEQKNVLVVDVRENHITLDIFEDGLLSENLFGKKEDLLSALKSVKGVVLTSETSFHSNGILGSVMMDKQTAEKVTRASAAFSARMKEKISKKAKVFPTGFEVKQGMIEDTNTEYVKKILEREGYTVCIGDILDDDVNSIAGGINNAIDEGYGLVITTGGVGAEDKDKTVEGLLLVDPEAAAPYLCKFEKGRGRHVKDGVRIAVGQIEYTKIISLPGPNDEVVMAMPALIEGLMHDEDKEILAERIANVLRAKYLGFHAAHHRHNKSFNSIDDR